MITTEMKADNGIITKIYRAEIVDMFQRKTTEAEDKE